MPGSHGDDSQESTGHEDVDLLGEGLEGAVNGGRERAESRFVPPAGLGAGEMGRLDRFRHFLPRRSVFRQKVPLQTAPKLLDASRVVGRKVVERRQVCGKRSVALKVRT